MPLLKSNGQSDCLKREAKSWRRSYINTTAVNPPITTAEQAKAAVTKIPCRFCAAQPAQ